MPTHDPSDDKPRRAVAKQLWPDANEVAHARALLSEIERRALSMSPSGAAVSAREVVARTVRGMFGDD
jgi:hypothetical protein